MALSSPSPCRSRELYPSSSSSSLSTLCVSSRSLLWLLLMRWSGGELVWKTWSGKHPCTCAGFYRDRPEGLKKYGYDLTWIIDADDTRDTGFCLDRPKPRSVRALACALHQLRWSSRVPTALLRQLHPLPIVFLGPDLILRLPPPVAPSDAAPL
jgi:hypothetical protein